MQLGVQAQDLPARTYMWGLRCRPRPLGGGVTNWARVDRLLGSRFRSPGRYHGLSEASSSPLGVHVRPLAPAGLHLG